MKKIIELNTGDYFRFVDSPEHLYKCIYGGVNLISYKHVNEITHRVKGVEHDAYNSELYQLVKISHL